MAPLVHDRPLNLWRWNSGIDGPRIVQQEIPKGAPEWIRRVVVPKRGGGEVCHAVGGEAATLIWLANQNCITPHVWSSRADRPTAPTGSCSTSTRRTSTRSSRSAGGARAGRRAARARARAVRDDDGLQGRARRGPAAAHAGRRRGARARAGDRRARSPSAIPETLTTSWRKEGRGGRVLVDTARNTYAQTAVAPYAVRAHPGRAGRHAAGLGGARRSRSCTRAAGRCARCRSASSSAATRGRTSRATPAPSRAADLPGPGPRRRAEVSPRRRSRGCCSRMRGNLAEARSWRWWLRAASAPSRVVPSQGGRRSLRCSGDHLVRGNDGIGRLEPADAVEVASWRAG